MTQAPKTGYETPVVKRMPDGTRVFPDSTKVRPANLPNYLQPDQMAGGISAGEVQQLIDQVRADVLAQVNVMLGNTVHIHNQSTPITSTVVTHNLGRRAVAVTLYSDDYETQYEFAEVYPKNDNQVIIALAEPLAYVAIIS